MWGQSALSRDIYVGYNNFKNMGSNTQQVVVNDGDGGVLLRPYCFEHSEHRNLGCRPMVGLDGYDEPGSG